MNNSTAIFAGLALIAAAVYVGNAPAYSQADASGWGPWNFKAEPASDQIWLLNSSTGQMLFCTKAECVKLKMPQ